MNLGPTIEYNALKVIEENWINWLISNTIITVGTDVV